MNNRILSYVMAQELTQEEAEHVGGGACGISGQYSNQNGVDDYKADVECEIF